MAAPSPSMCPVLIGDTTSMFCGIDGISLTETCPLWLGVAVVYCQRYVLVLPQTMRFSVIPTLEVMGGYPN